MKKFIYCIILSIITFSNLYAQTWMKQQEGIASTIVRRMDFLNSTTGYCTLGDTAGGIGYIMKTTNAGDNWTKIPTSCTSATYDVKFLDDNTGFCCSFKGELAMTTNAGMNWTNVYNTSNPNLYLNTIGFFDNNTGFTAGYSRAARTTNGGLNWTTISVGFMVNSNIILSSTRALLCGSANNISEGGVWLSTNAGASWVYTQLSTSALQSFYFFDANTGFVAGGGGKIFKTTDGGSNWTNVSTAVSNPYYSIYFQDVNTGFLGSSNGTLFRTTNGGANYNSVSFNINSGQSTYDIHFFDANNGIISGSTGTFYKTTNNGLNWTSIGEPNSLLNAIQFVNASTGYTTGERRFQKTTNAGASWQSIGFIDLNTTSMDFPSASTGYVGGTAGNMRKSTDGGNSWSFLTTGLSGFVTAIDFVNTTTGFAGTSNANMKKTTTGGSTWTDITLGVTATVNSIQFLNSNTGYFCGSSGNARKTTNGGANWSAMTTGVTQNLNSIYFINDNIGFAAGNAGTIIKTTDAGANWSTQISGIESDLNSVSFGSVNDGIAVGNSGVVLVTTNGGDSWSAQVSGTTKNLRSISFASSNSIFVSGENAIILNSIDQVLPVELSGFTSSVSGRNIMLSWSTLSETNNKGFAVERSLSGANAWNNIGFVEGKGTSNIQQSYSFTDANLYSGAFAYRLKQMDNNGNFVYKYLSNEVIIGKPLTYELNQNYPNPFNPSTKINFQIASDSKVTLKIFDITGKEIRTLVDGFRKSDYYTVDFNASALPSGIYFARLAVQNESAPFIKSIKLVLSK